MTSIGRSALGLAVVAAACTYNPPPVPLLGRPSEVESLAGQWTGAYRGGMPGRSGSIELSLVAGEDHAHGDVLMVPSHSRRAYQSWRERGPGQGPEPPQQLTIRFVALASGDLIGELDPYLDPDCDCRALTHFRGRVKGRVIEGTFVTYTAEAAMPSHGTWEVRRRQ